MDVSQARALLQRYRAGETNPEENRLVEEWFQRLVSEGEWSWSEGEQEALAVSMESYLLTQIDQTQQETPRRIRFLEKRWLRYAAAVILLAGAVSIYRWVSRSPSSTSPAISATPAPALNDIGPGQSGAILTLSDGSQIVLDSAANGLLSTQGNVKVLLDNGQVSYKPENAPATEILYNTMSTPNGRQYKLLLPDGTAVWLNAASSITYPTVFTSNERKVEITGEAYFEVKKDPGRKFLVSAGGSTTEVLGTHFNVNAYHDEKDIRISLLEGSVIVRQGEDIGRLTPGQQAQALESGRILINKDIDIEAVMAWKNGYFDFDRASLAVIMLQVARWYDAEIIYQDNVQGMDFSGAVPRKENISEVLKMLELTGVIHFRTEGKKVYVSR